MLPGGRRLACMSYDLRHVSWVRSAHLHYEYKQYTDPAQHLIATGEDLDDLHHDLSEVCTIRRKSTREEHAEPFSR